jgi:hypothetical protein
MEIITRPWFSNKISVFYYRSTLCKGPAKNTVSKETVSNLPLAVIRVCCED